MPTNLLIEKGYDVWSIWSHRLSLQHLRQHSSAFTSFQYTRPLSQYTDAICEKLRLIGRSLLSEVIDSVDSTPHEIAFYTHGHDSRMHTPLLLNMYDNLLYVARQRESERICLRCSRLLNSRCAFRARALRSVFNEIASREQANYFFSSDLFF